MIKKPADMINTENKFRVLIAGYPGIGKTTLGLSAPKPLLIDTDFGVNRIIDRLQTDCIQPNTYQELLNDLTLENLKEYETLVIDTGGKLLDLMKPHVIKLDIKNAKKDGSLSQAGYGAIGRAFKDLVYKIHHELKKHLVVIFHVVEDKQDEETKLRILVEGSTKNTIWQEMDIGGFIEKRNGKRTIGFEPCERYFAKRTQGVKAMYNVPELDDGVSGDFLTKLFEEMDNYIKETGKKFQKEQEEYQQVMDKYVPIIENMTTENVQEVSDLMQTIEHKLTSKQELTARFKEKLKELNMHYNKETKQYEVKQETTKNEEEMATKMIPFMKAAKEAIKEPDKQYTFTCPLCGGEATGGKAGTNNHIHAKCNKCNISIMQ